MLEGIRKRRNSLIILLAFAAIIIVFIFWGVGPSGDGSGQSMVAKVEGTPITVKEYSGLYKRQVDYYKNAFKEQFNDEMEEKLDLKRTTLNMLISRALAINEAKKQGIEVTEKEVQEVIASMPVFHKNNAFDKDTYVQTLSQNRLKPAEFEKSIEADILTTKMRDKVLKDINVTDEEVRKRYIEDNRLHELSYLTIDPASFMSQLKATDAEAQEYLKRNGSEFMVPAKIKAAYARLDFGALSRNVKITENEIKEFYEKNKGEFQSPPSVKARHILVRPDEKAKDAKKAMDEARKNAESLLGKIKAGEDFSKLAKAHSKDPGSAKQGGDLGWFPKGVMVKQFEEAAFSLEKGQVSGIVETDFGFHIIKVDDVKPAGYAPLEEARPMVKELLSREKAQKAAAENIGKIEAAFKSTSDPDTLKKAAKEHGAEAEVTGYFSSDNPMVELTHDEMLRENAFSLRAGETSRVIESPAGLYIVKVLDRKEAHVPDYKAIADDVKEKVKKSKANDAAKKKAEELLAAAKGGKDIGELAAKEKLKVSTTGFFKKAQGIIPGINVFSEGHENVFGLTKEAPLHGEILSANEKHYIVRFKAAKEADMAGFERMKEGLRRKLLSVKHEDELNKWIDGLRSKAKIEVYENML